MLTEMQKEWFRNLIEEEIRQEEGTAENEECWAKGAADGEEKSMHCSNAAEHRSYAAFLCDLLLKYAN